MDRTQFTVEVSHSEGAESESGVAQPMVHLQFNGSIAHLRGQLSERLRDGMDATEIDVSYRSPRTGDNPTAGVLTLSDRVTGIPILEVEVAPELIATLVQAVRTSGEHSGGDGQYRLEIRADETVLTEFERDLVLVYDADGTLDRQTSLIPGGVEL